MPVAAAIPAIVGGASSVLGGIFGGGAAKKAANTQSAAANRVASLALDTSNADAANLTTNAGSGSLQIGAVGQDAADRSLAAGGAAAGGMLDASGRAVGGVTGAAGTAASGVLGAAGAGQAGIGISKEQANAILQQIYGSSMDSLSPYKDAGSQALSQISKGTQEGGQFAKQFTAADMEANDPGYQFRLEQGQKALERSAAARGGLGSGGTLKELTDYSQGAASAEYQNAFTRFQQGTAQRYNMLNNVAGMGQRATETGIAAGQAFAGQASANEMAAGKIAGDYGMAGATSAGQFGLQGATTAGGFDMSGAKAAGDFGVAGADTAGRFSLGSTEDAISTYLNALGRSADIRGRGVAQAGQAIEGGANAQAAGTVGAANAWTGAIGGVGKAAATLPWSSWFGKTPTDLSMSTQPG